MLSETSTTITPDEPEGTIVRRCGSNERTEATVAASAATAATANTSRTSIVRRAMPRRAATSCESIAVLRLRRIVRFDLLTRGFAIYVLAHTCGETRRVDRLGLPRPPRERACRGSERPVSLVEVLGNELQRPTTLRSTVQLTRLLEQRERPLERRHVRRRRRCRRLGRRRLGAARERGVGESRPTEEKRSRHGEEQRDQYDRRKPVRDRRQRCKVGAPRGAVLVAATEVVRHEPGVHHEHRPADLGRRLSSSDLVVRKPDRLELA